MPTGGIGLLIQDATVAFNYYLLHLGNNKLAGFIALNCGIVLATLFRFWSYRRFVWVAPPLAKPGTPGAPGRRGPATAGGPASRRGSPMVPAPGRTAPCSATP